MCGKTKTLVLLALILFSTTANASIDLNYYWAASSQNNTTLTITTKTNNAGTNVNKLEVILGERKYEKQDFTPTQVGLFEKTFENNELLAANRIAIYAENEGENSEIVNDLNAKKQILLQANVATISQSNDLISQTWQALNQTLWEGQISDVQVNITIFWAIIGIMTIIGLFYWLK